MPELERLHGLRVVADPASLNGASWAGDGDGDDGGNGIGDVTVLRFAPDDAFAIGAASVEIDDEHAIVEQEAGFVGAWVDLAVVTPHIEWSLPTDRPALAQGAIAGVPAKLWLPADDGTAFLVVAAAYADELSERLR